MYVQHGLRAGLARLRGCDTFTGLDFGESLGPFGGCCPSCPTSTSMRATSAEMGRAGEGEVGGGDKGEVSVKHRREVVPGSEAKLR